MARWCVVVSVLLLASCTTTSPRTPVSVVEPPLPYASALAPEATLTYAQQEDLFRTSTTWWDAYYKEHPGPLALRHAAAMHVAWADRVFNDESVAALGPRLSDLQATKPKDCYGVWIVARALHLQQRFKESAMFLAKQLEKSGDVYVWWAELGAAAAAGGVNLSDVDVATQSWKLAANMPITERVCEGHDPSVSPMALPDLKPSDFR